MRTQADRDDDLAIGRELERKDAEIARLRAALEVIAGSSDRLQAMQAKNALDNIGTNIDQQSMNPEK